MKFSPKIRAAAVLLILGGAMAFTAAVTSIKYPIERNGPFTSTISRFDSTNIGGVGGVVTSYLSGDSSWVGDVVYISAKNTIKHDTILSNYDKVAGVVVGGARTSGQTYIDSASVGTLAATSGQVVFILTRGRAWVTVDTQAGIAPGKILIPSNRQGQRGRVAAKTTAIDSFYRAIGRIADTGVIGTKRLANITIR